MALAIQKLVTPTSSGLTFPSLVSSKPTCKSSPSLATSSISTHSLCTQLSSLRVTSSPRTLFLSPSSLSRSSPSSSIAPVVQATLALDEPVVEEKKAKAILKNLRMSSTKVRRVINQVRGRSYEDILMILQFMPYRACEPVYNLVLSCAANAENNYGLTKSQLYVSEALVDVGPTLKRFQPRAQGRGFPIRKRTCMVTITMKEIAK